MTQNHPAAMISIEPRSALTSFLRGFRRRCPNCGVGSSLRAYLKVRESCDHCGEPLGQIRADDFPAYLTIVIVGHIVVPLVLVTEQNYALPLLLQMVAWPALTLALALLLLPRIKGAILGLMWALRLRGDEH